MTSEGRLQRGKANYEYTVKGVRVGRFLDNSETKEYIATLKKPKAEAVKLKEAENAKSTK